MQVDVISSVIEVRSDDFVQKTVIAIDVLRATSTIVTALAHGCSSVVPVETVNQAKQLQLPEDLLGGERFCKKIAGFHFGNSPFEYMTPDIAGKRIVLTTTNGTRAIQKAQRASHVLAGSLLNASACARAAVALKRDVVILCAGTQDEFSLEDGLCAGLLIRKLEDVSNECPETNDFGAAMRLAYDSASDRLEETLLQGSNGKRLSKIGYREDVSFCSQIDRFDLVPILRDQAMIRF
ncbi:2-phosphosulfolactate phosphatase [Paenibacillus flagellatus]|uniref:Probable 2-phosphosulfolactate phosphatase n=1 Tax=Paenibacillus flagellatus TaxID=2211139 RepID=A0A2V5KTJ2_9BACL|nr:2-phosphosulfolactate phosphatase [Paenibacillus flagellatus]PYI55067.1 2-phosphosulfolactate phosphatase [Paenibacillus flagellatus]